MKKTFSAIFALLFVLSQAGADELDDLFSDPDSLVIEESAQIEKPEEKIFEGDKFTWAGDFSGTAGSSLGYRDAISEIDDWADPDENLLLALKARLWFDARPDNDFRVFGKFTTEYPFKTDVAASAGSGSVPVTNVGVFELFSDFNWKDRVFFRLGKQNTGWGVSRFYQVADPLSVGVKDPTDPSADLEGPVALKASVPFGLNSLVFVAAVKDSYLPESSGDASIRDVGVGVKADIHVEVPDNKVVGNGQLSLGVYGQRNLAPKAVVSYSTSVRKFQLFTDQVVSFGLDSYRLTDDEVTVGSGADAVTVKDTEKPWRDPFYSATLGTMYVNNDWNFTLYAEYLFNGAGSAEKTAYEDWLARAAAERNPAGALPVTLSGSDLGGYLGMHNTALSLSWSDLFGNDDLGFSATWLQNWIDLSGMVRPAVTWVPFKHLTVECGANLVWGDDGTEWAVKNSDPSSLDPVRTAGYLAFKLSDGRF